MFVEHLTQFLLIRDINIVVLRPLPTDKLYAVNHLLERVVEIVNNDDLVSGFETRERGEGADIAGAAVTENGFVS